MITKNVKQNDKEIETFITHLTADLRFSVWPVSKSGKSFPLISRMRLDNRSFKQLSHLKQEDSPLLCGHKSQCNFNAEVNV